MITRTKLKNYLNSLLNVFEYQDYCPNGLQVEGKNEIKKIAFAVSATKESIEKAVAIGADALVVHHGLFWKFHGTKKLTGPFYKRVAPLIKNDINLLAYHLPLDANLEVGNAKAIGDYLNLENIKAFGDYKGMPTGIKGRFPNKIKASELKEKLHKILDHNILHSSPDDEQMIKSIGIITGGANSDWINSQKEGLDAYLTGEMSEHDWHEAKESEIHFYAGGHNATEQFGVQRLLEKLNKDFDGLELFYLPSQNPA